MEKRKALGKGLQALIPDVKTAPLAADGTDGLEIKESIVYLNTTDISPGRYQPRTAFNQQRLQELVSSIKEKGAYGQTEDKKFYSSIPFCSIK